MQTKQIPSFPNYFATDCAKIIGHRNKPMHQSRDKDGYLIVRVRKDGKYWTKKVHRFVCEAFHGPCPNDDKKCVLHNDGDNQNNHPSNLRWGNPKENAQDALAHLKSEGITWAHWNQGNLHKLSKLTPELVHKIRSIPNDAPRGTKTAMAKALGVSPALITNVRKRKAWKHIAS